MPLQLNTLTVGQKVAIAHCSSFGTISNQGVYVVSKVNKLKVALTRESDGYERLFSIKRDAEIRDYGVETSYDKRSFIETVEEQNARKEALAKKTEISLIWKKASEAVESRNLTELKLLVAELESKESK